MESEENKIGGNALKNTKTRRYEAAEYHALAEEVRDKLMSQLPFNFVEVLKSYRNKPSFGDMDILLSSDRLPQDFEEIVGWMFDPNQLVRNGNVISFDYKELQIDLIITKPEEFISSCNYFAYNDLGNLLGRIAHSMGLKLGHDGLSYNWRVETYQFICTLLGTLGGTNERP